MCIDVHMLLTHTFVGTLPLYLCSTTVVDEQATTAVPAQPPAAAPAAAPAASTRKPAAAAATTRHLKSRRLRSARTQALMKTASFLRKSCAHTG